nr:VP6 [Rotavirus A]
MDVLFSLAKTLKEARDKIVEGTLYSNVQTIVQQVNQVIQTLNGNTFVTGGIGLKPIRNWNFDFGYLGTTLLHLDPNYVDNARNFIDYTIDFVNDICETEVCLESQRNGIAPQSDALRALSAAKFKRINFNNDSEFIENWNLQHRRQRTGFKYHNPNILPYAYSFTLTRSQPVHDDVCGTIWLNNGNELQVAGFDSQCAQNAAGGVQQFVHTINLKRAVTNATVTLLPGADKFATRMVIPSVDGATTWFLNPVVFRPSNVEVNFMLNGAIVSTYQGRFGTLIARNCDAIEISFQLIRPQNMTPNVAALFPNAAPYPNHAMVGVTMRIDSAVCESVLNDGDSTKLATVTSIRQEYAAPAQAVFPPGMNWSDLLSNYSASREDNLQRVLTVASIRSMLVK